MQEFVYISKASPDITPKDITDILETARTFNMKNNITGCLLFHNNEFLQILEGDKAVLENLYARIEKDKRHSHVKLLAQGEKTDRTFDHWSMAFNELSNDNAQILSKEVFSKNIFTLSQIENVPTFTMVIFWNRVKNMLAL